MFNYLKIANASDLKGRKGLKFKSVSQDDICSYIKKNNPNKYRKDCKFDNRNKIEKFDIGNINRALQQANHKYKKCEVEEESNLIKSYKKKFKCFNKYDGGEEVIYISAMGEIISDAYRKNRKTNNRYWTYKGSDWEVKNDTFYLKINLIEHQKTNYNNLIKKNASYTINEKLFKNKNTENIQFYKKKNRYGFSINEKKFYLYICNKESNLDNIFAYNKGGCYIKSYTQVFNENNENRYISKKLNENKPILNLIGRDTKKQNGKIYFNELQGKASNNFRFLKR